MHRADLEQAAGVGSGAVAEVDVLQRGFAHRRHDGDGLCLAVEAELGAHAHDDSGVLQLLALVAGDRLGGDRSGAQRAVRSAGEGGGAAGTHDDGDHQEEHSDECEGGEHCAGDEADAALARGGHDYWAGWMRSASHGWDRSKRSMTTVKSPAFVGTEISV